MTDNFSELLLKRYEKGDAQAAAEIYSRYSKRLLKLARNRLTQLLNSKVDPEDIAQDSFIAFFDLADQGKVRWDREGDLWRLLAGIASNQVRRQHQHFAASKRNVADERKVELDWISTAGNDEAASAELFELLETILETEKPLARRVLLSRLAGHSMEEIARQNNRSSRTIRRVLNSLKSRFIDTHSHLSNAIWIQQQYLDPLNSDSESAQSCLTADHQNYDLMRMIGVGGFGKVYLARDNRTDRVVAFKALKARWLGNEVAESAFKNEAQVLSRLSHPNIVRFVEAGPLPNGSWFIVTEFEQGVSLAQIELSDDNRETIIQWMLQTASGIAALHQHSVVHGDIKPANLMLNKGRAVLLDFGFAQCRASLMQPSTGYSEAFSAPERIAHFAADVYSFGKLIEFAMSKPGDSTSSTSITNLITNMTDPDFENRPNIKEVERELLKMT